MTRAQGWCTIALLAFLCAHLLAADVVGLYLYSQIGDDTSVVQITDSPSPDVTITQPDDTQTDFPECDPEGDVCP
jgi:hypothetical protein